MLLVANAPRGTDVAGCSGWMRARKRSAFTAARRGLPGRTSNQEVGGFSLSGQGSSPGGW